MRHPIRIDLGAIENWLAKVEIQSEKQNNFVESIFKIVANVREKDDFNIVLVVDDDIVLYRLLEDGREIIDSDEKPLYYAQCIALGLCDWNEWC